VAIGSGESGPETLMYYRVKILRLVTEVLMSSKVNTIFCDLHSPFNRSLKFWNAMTESAQLNPCVHHVSKTVNI